MGRSPGLPAGPSACQTAAATRAQGGGAAVPQGLVSGLRTQLALLQVTRRAALRACRGPVRRQRHAGAGAACNHSQSPAGTQKLSSEMDASWRMHLLREPASRADVWKRKVEQVSEEADSLRIGLEKFHTRQQRCGRGPPARCSGRAGRLLLHQQQRDEHESPRALSRAPRRERAGGRAGPGRSRATRHATGWRPPPPALAQAAPGRRPPAGAAGPAGGRRRRDQR